MKKIFDPTISIGNIISLIGMIGAIGVGYASITSDLAVLKYQMSDTQVRIASIETRLSANRTAEVQPSIYKQVKYEEESPIILQAR